MAERLGIQTPSLYNHVEGLAGLRRDLALHSARVLSAAGAAAVEGLSGKEWLRAAAQTHRSFARDHPGLYEALLPAPKPGEDDQLYEAMAESVAVRRRCCRCGWRSWRHDSRHQGATVVVHGFVHLETNDGFGMPVDIDTSYDRVVDLVIEWIAAR